MGSSQGQHPLLKILPMIARIAIRDGDQRRLSLHGLCCLAWLFHSLTCAAVGSTHGEGGRVHMHLTSCDTKDLPRFAGDPGKQFRRVVSVQPIQGATQTVVIEHFGLDPSTQQVLNWFVSEVLWHQIQLPVAEAQSIQNHRYCCRSHAYLLTIPWVLVIQPRCKTDLLSHARHNSQVVEPFIHIQFRCGHRESSSAVDSTLPIFGKTVNHTPECGLILKNKMNKLMMFHKRG